MKKLITDTIAFLIRLMYGHASDMEIMLFGIAIIVCSVIIICALNHFLFSGLRVQP
jgi:hypothetical protein